MEWRREDRSRLRRKIRKVVIDTPEKPWDLPEYVLRLVNVREHESVLTWERKGQRLLRGANRKFIRNRFVDDEAVRSSVYVDEEAESTSRDDSSDVSESGSDSSSSSFSGSGPVGDEGDLSDSGVESDGLVSLVDL